MLADLLLEKEVIFKENLEEIFGKRPWHKEEVVNQDVETTPEPQNGVPLEKQAEDTSETETAPEEEKG